MQTDIIKGKLERSAGHIQKKWGELTDQDVQEIKGEQRILEGKLQERYGHSKEEAAQYVNDFLDSI